VTPRENEALRQENETLRRRLAEAEQVNEALTKGQIDAVVDAAYQVPLLLHQAQDALRESEERYRGLFENMVEGYAHCRMVLDRSEPRDFVYLDVNRAFGQLTGLHDVVGKPVTEVLPGIRESNPELFQIFGRVALTGNPEAFETYLPSLGIWFAITVYSSKKMHFIAVFHDVTERKAADERLRDSEEQFRTMFDFASVGVAQANPKTGRLLRVNPKLCLITGYSAEELLTRRFSDITNPDDRERDWALFERTMTTGGSEYQTEKRYVRKDGSIVWANVNVSVLRDATGVPTRTIAMIQDITESRRAAELLRESEGRYRALFDESALPMWLFDQETLAIAEVNEAAVRHYGYSREEFLSKTVREIWHPDEVAEAIALLAASSEEPRSAVLRHVKKGGASITVEVFWRAVQLASRSYRLSVIRDITDQRELEERFRQSQKMEAVGRLAGGVAHDFNNLLTVIFGYSDILLQGLEPGPLHEAMQEVRRAGERAVGLTRQLLAFSRKQTLVAEVLDLGDVVSGLSTMVERLIGEDVKVSVVVSPGLGRVKADRGQLEQVVMNLAVNARDAMPKGGSLIFELQNVELDDAYTATHAEVKPGPYVLLAISDTGTGMDAETQKRIFEPFFTTKEAGKGTGLGLSTVYGIVHQSGGAIDVYSEPGRGTTFKVYLPRFADDAAVRRPVSGLHPALAAGSGSETVLVVEDEAAIRQLTNLVLQKAGYTVLLAESPVTAERIAGSHPGPIHLMLTDVVMPGMRGPELAQRLIRLRPDLRVLYMSGYIDNAIAHHGFLDAGTEFLQKPFSPSRLMQKIREVLSRGSQDAGSSSAGDG
jgi:PAS domain S-box-containing protein